MARDGEELSLLVPAIQAVWAYRGVEAQPPSFPELGPEIEDDPWVPLLMPWLAEGPVVTLPAALAVVGLSDAEAQPTHRRRIRKLILALGHTLTRRRFAAPPDGVGSVQRALAQLQQPVQVTVQQLCAATGAEITPRRLMQYGRCLLYLGYVKVRPRDETGQRYVAYRRGGEA